MPWSRVARGDRSRPGGTVCHFLQTFQKSIGCEQGGFQVGFSVHFLRMLLSTFIQVHLRVQVLRRGGGSASYKPQGYSLTLRCVDRAGCSPASEYFFRVRYLFCAYNLSS